MHILATSTEIFTYPWDGPATYTQTEIETLPVYTAVILESLNREPLDSEWEASTWIAHEVAHKVTSLTPGSYLVFGRLVCAATGEDIRKLCGRLRTGDDRS